MAESLSSAGIRNIDLLEITYEESLKCFALNEQCTQIDGFPVRRGMCFPIDKNTMYLFTHGIAPSVISPNRRYFQGGKSVPLPLKVVKYYGSGDMVQIATEILGLSKMNWNSFCPCVSNEGSSQRMHPLYDSYWSHHSKAFHRSQNNTQVRRTCYFFRILFFYASADGSAEPSQRLHLQ